MTTATKGKLQTNYGEVEYSACCGADYVYIGTIEPIEVFGVFYSGHYRMKQVNGLWEPEGSGALYLSRRDNYGDGSRAARETVRKAFTAAWTEFVAANPGVLTKAAREQLEKEIERLIADYHETWEKLEQIRKDRQTKTDELNQLNERIRTARFTKPRDE
jgi:hypothetical protein